MNRFINQIRDALEAGCYLVALQSTMACIDMCGALASDNGRSTRSKFKEWYEANMPSEYMTLSPEDAYLLRCGMLHQGRAASSRYRAVIFAIPDTRGGLHHNNVLNGALQLDLVTFCTDVLAAAEAWWMTARHTEPVATHAQELVTLWPFGLEPYIVGIPVYA